MILDTSKKGVFTIEGEAPPQKALGIERNELNKESKGGTELMADGLYDHLHPDLRDLVQIIPSRVRTVDADRPSILWFHDLPEDPESQMLKDKKFQKQFDAFVFVSFYQRNRYQAVYDLPWKKTHVIHNAITPVEEHSKPNDGIIRLVYNTTPHRGLELLVVAFEEICKQSLPFELQLEVFSSFSAYGSMWKKNDATYQPVFDKCESHPQINYHGFQPHDVLMEKLKECHIMAYPNIWEETFCLSVVDCMSAGLEIVCPDFGALPEVTGGMASMYRFDENPNVHVNRFANVLFERAHRYWEEGNQNRLDFARVWVNNNFNWNIAVNKWENLIKELAL